jgi:hypothetical protein
MPIQLELRPCQLLDSNQCRARCPEPGNRSRLTWVERTCQHRAVLGHHRDRFQHMPNLEYGETSMAVQQLKAVYHAI